MVKLAAIIIFPDNPMANLSLPRSENIKAGSMTINYDMTLGSEYMHYVL